MVNTVLYQIYEGSKLWYKVVMAECDHYLNVRSQSIQIEFCISMPMVVLASCQMSEQE
jgi:hypothetical protein